MKHLLKTIEMLTKQAQLDLETIEELREANMFLDRRVRELEHHLSPKEGTDVSTFTEAGTDLVDQRY